VDRKNESIRKEGKGRNYLPRDSSHMFFAGEKGRFSGNGEFTGNFVFPDTRGEIRSQHNKEGEENYNILHKGGGATKF